MTVTYGVLLAAALLLLASGVASVRRPARATAALRALGVRVPGSGRLLGVLEVGLAAGLLLRGGVVATVLLGAAYLGFAGVVEVGRRRGLADCGCFGGAAETPPTGLHVGLTLVVGVLVLATAALSTVPSLAGALGESPGRGVPLLAGAALTAWLLHLALQLLAALPTVGARAVDDGPRLFALTAGATR